MSQHSRTKPSVSMDLVPMPVKVTSLVTFVYVYQGKQKRYTFNPGETLEVDPEDLEGLLAIKSRGGGCCGYKDPGGQPYFQRKE